MTEATANKWIITSSLLTAGIWGYRRITQGEQKTSPSLKTYKELVKAKEKKPAPVGVFITGWGVTYIGLSAAAIALPAAGGGLAIIIALATLLGNGQQLSGDVKTALDKEKDREATPTPKTSSSTKTVTRSKGTIT